MHKLLLVGLVAAAPMLVAPSGASAWGCGYGYSAPRYSYGYTAPRYYGYNYSASSLALLRCANLRLACRIGCSPLGLGWTAPLVGGLPRPGVLWTSGPRACRATPASTCYDIHPNRR